MLAINLGSAYGLYERHTSVYECMSININAPRYVSRQSAQREC